MSKGQQNKLEIINGYKVHEGDTGSTQVQIALLSGRIEYLTEHMKQHKKDFKARRGLLILVAKRRSFLNYLKTKDKSSYEEIIKKLEIRVRKTDSAS